MNLKKNSLGFDPSDFQFLAQGLKNLKNTLKIFNLDVSYNEIGGNPEYSGAFTELF